MGKDKVEELREKLYKEIESYGRDSPIVLETSKELDLYIVEELKKYHIYNEGKLKQGIFNDK